MSQNTPPPEQFAKPSGAAPAANPSQEYLRNAVLTATPEQLQLMLYDGAIRFASRGLEAIRAKNREAAFNALERAQLIAIELSNGIRREVNPELADRMLALYNFIWRRLVDANIHQDEKAAQDALRVLHHQRETWTLLMNKLQRQAGAAPATAAGPADVPDPDGASSFVAEG